MPTLILVRHGRTDANAQGILAGRTRGIGLDPTGRTQAARVAERLAAVPLSLIVSSPLMRTMQTARTIAEAQPDTVPVRRDAGLVECDYGRWTGRAITDLAKQPLWASVQQQPSAVVFPGGEAMTTMAARAVETARRIDRRVARRHGGRAVWVAVSHGDVIKAIVADALGTHLDLFQRIAVSPGSVSAITYGTQRPTVHHVNDLGSDLSGLVPPAGDSKAATGDAPVGGGA
ncbi:MULTISPECIES: MSMEG_4193 family putative phosphomutase [Mumia]|uniref:MSMEG_4193 family putative phosphomutase n=1 Tax=Mumia TaxID=1546255 RepID=UPI0015F8352E|nr:MULTISPECIES: MSMEG_4193 family putative phosphomutase [unclassified Mumia]QMW64685.1 MSMEG_4193 family putative phosphomutase [Mumia sp. ZJ1417]